MPIEPNSTTENLLSTGEEAGRNVKTRTQRFWNGFSDFALQDNVLEVGVGLMWVSFSFFAFFGSSVCVILVGHLPAQYVDFGLWERAGTVVFLGLLAWDNCHFVCLRYEVCLGALGVWGLGWLGLWREEVFTFLRLSSTGSCQWERRWIIGA